MSSPRTAPQGHSRRVRLVQHDEHSPFPQPLTLQLGSIAGIQHPPALLGQVGIVQGSEHLPQVPAEAEIQWVRGDTPGIQQLVELI